MTWSVLVFFPRTVRWECVLWQINSFTIHGHYKTLWLSDVSMSLCEIHQSKSNFRFIMNALSPVNTKVNRFSCIIHLLQFYFGWLSSSDIFHQLQTVNVIKFTDGIINDGSLYGIWSGAITRNEFIISIFRASSRFTMKSFCRIIDTWSTEFNLGKQ